MATELHVRDDDSLMKSERLEPLWRRWISVLMGLLIVYVIVRGVLTAATKPFWFDELITLTVSQLPSMKAVWGALSRALDSPPPGFYVIQRAFVGLLREKEISLRLASILAFPCTLVCVFVYARRRSGEAIAFLCALFLLLTNLFSRFAVEARPYSMMIVCIAFALVCYQRVPSPWWTVLFGVSLVVAQTLHHYAVFAMVPFGLAETVYWWRARKFRWQVWLALLAGAMPLLFFWPLLDNIRKVFGVHFFEVYGYSSIPGTYGQFFSTDSAFAAAIVAVCIAGVIGRYLLPRGGAGAAASRVSDADAAEGTLLLAFILLPLITFTIVRVMHGGMRDAYVLASLLGIALALAGALSLARPGVVALFAVFIIFSVAVREYKFWRAKPSLHFVSPTASVQGFIEGNGYPELPVVVSSGMKYTPLAHYASPAFAKRLFYLMDPEKQNKYQGNDTFDKNVIILRDYMPLQVVDFSEFTVGHPEFLLYTEEPDDGGTWLPIYLSREAESMRTVVVEQSRRLYLVRMKGAPQG